MLVVEPATGNVKRTRVEDSTGGKTGNGKYADMIAVEVKRLPSRYATKKIYYQCLVSISGNLDQDDRRP